MITLHVQPTVLWREANTYCECACVSSEWTLRLCVGSTLVEERAGDRITPFLPIAQQWRENVTRRVLGDGELTSEPNDDRRHGAIDDRRAVRRAGRRGETAIPIRSPHRRASRRSGEATRRECAPPRGCPYVRGPRGSVDQANTIRQPLMPPDIRRYGHHTEPRRVRRICIHRLRAARTCEADVLQQSGC